MRGVLKRGIIYLAILMFLFALLVVTATINPEKMRGNISKSSQILISEDRCLIGNIIMTQKDRTADGVLMNMIINTDYHNPVKSSLLSMHYYGSDRGGAFALSETLEGSPADTSYSRYWHGSLIFTRMLLLFMNINQIRVFLSALLIISALAFAIFLIKKGYTCAVICFILSFFLCGICFGGVSIETFYVPFFAIIAAFCVIRLRDENNRILLFLLTGLFTAFFDFLTAETLTMTIPLLFMLYDMEKTGNMRKTSSIQSNKSNINEAKSTTLFCIKCCVSWFIGYAATFAIKWIISAALGLSASEGVKETLLYRFVGDHVTLTERGFENVTGIRKIFLALGSNISTLFWRDATFVHYYVAFIVFICVLLVLAYIFYLFRRDAKSAVRPYHYAIVALIPILRIIVLSEHSLQHHFFVYRALWALVLAIMIIFSEEMLWSKK